MLSFGASALAQAPHETKSDEQKALERARVDGAAGGTGNPVAQGEGNKEAIRGKPNRHDHRLRQAPARGGRVHDEQSSDREAARGARGNN